MHLHLQMEISPNHSHGVTLAQTRFRLSAVIGSFYKQPPYKLHSICTRTSIHIQCHLKQEPQYWMLLTCIGERISTILLQPGHKNQNYITSLHNEVVRIIQCSYMISISLNLSLDIAGCRVDCWTSATRWQLSCARVCEGCLPQFFRH